MRLSLSEGRIFVYLCSMKKILVTVIMTATAICAFAQPRSIGLRTGVSGFEADYQHIFAGKNQFLEANFGIDFGYNANGKPGVKATALYNFVWARPAWTEKGSWALYAGPGLSTGYVNDMTVWKAENGVEIRHAEPRIGFMVGICGQVGLEYTFWFPLQLAVDLRPTVGIHVNEGISVPDPLDPTKEIKYGSRVGFYENGLLGFAPTISVRYRF